MCDVETSKTLRSTNRGQCLILLPFNARDSVIGEMGYPALAENTQNFGSYAPNAVQGAIITLTKKQTDSWLGRRIALLLRKFVLTTLKTPMDVSVFGQKMRLHPFNNVCEKRILFTPQFFDREERALLSEHLPDDYIFIDVGANIGAYSLFVAGLEGKNGRVIAFEPQPSIHARFQYNLSLNPNVEVDLRQMAVADSDGELTFFQHEDNFGEGSLIAGQDDDGLKTISVASCRLDRFVEREDVHRIDAIKLDIEGAEETALLPFFQNASEDIWPGLIILERSDRRWTIDLVSFLRERGYTTVRTTRMNYVLKRNDIS